MELIEKMYTFISRIISAFKYVRKSKLSNLIFILNIHSCRRPKIRVVLCTRYKISGLAGYHIWLYIFFMRKNRIFFNFSPFLSFNAVSAHNIYNFGYTATGYTANKTEYPTGYQKRPDIRHVGYPVQPYRKCYLIGSKTRYLERPH